MYIDDISKVTLDSFSESNTVELDLGYYFYNYSNCIYAYITKTEDGRFRITTDYKECVDTVDTLTEALSIVNDLELGVYAECSGYTLRRQSESSNS